MKRKTFLRGAATLGVSGAAVKFLGALYRVPLVAFIGCYGLGIYQSSYAFFAFISTLCSAGIASALSKQVADLRARGVSAVPVVSDYLRLFVRAGLIGGLAVAVFPLVFMRRGARRIRRAISFLRPPCRSCAFLPCCAARFRARTTCCPRRHRKLRDKSRKSRSDFCSARF